MQGEHRVRANGRGMGKVEGGATGGDGGREEGEEKREITEDERTPVPLRPSPPSACSEAEAPRRGPGGAGKA